MGNDVSLQKSVVIDEQKATEVTSFWIQGKSSSLSDLPTCFNLLRIPRSSNSDVEEWDKYESPVAIQRRHYFGGVLLEESESTGESWKCRAIE